MVAARMVDWRIPLYKIDTDESDVDAIAKVIRRKMYWTGGPLVGQLESQVASYVGCKHGIAFNSGTSGLFAISEALKLQPNDEVIVPSFTFISTCNSVAAKGAKPIFAEIEPKYYGLDPKDVKARITDKTKAIYAVHYAGGACRIAELAEIASDAGVYLVEDAAESLGCQINGRKVGSYGSCAMFSFCGNKVVTTGEGGLVVTNDSEMAEKMSLIRSHGRFDNGQYFDSSDSFDYLLLGHNWRMSDITAALGISQFGRLSTIIEKRRSAARLYDELLQDLPVITPEAIPNTRHIYQMYSVLFRSNKDRESARNELERAGIMSKVYFDCVHLTSFYRQKFLTKEGQLPVTEDISNRILTLPLYPDMKPNDVETVCSRIQSALANS